MIQTGKKLFTKLVTAVIGLIMLTGIMVVSFDNNWTGLLVISQASPVYDLNLNEQQKTNIQGIFRQTSDQIKQLKANTHINRSPFARNQAQKQVRELFKEIETIRSNALEEVRSQLEPIQQATFDQLTSKIKEANKNQIDLLQSLELTQQQKMAIAKVTEQSKEKMWDVLGDGTLSKDQKITQVIKMKQDATNNIREQLTTEQQTKFDAWRKQQQEDSIL